jgi:hypothetical protein
MCCKDWLWLLGSAHLSNNPPDPWAWDHLLREGWWFVVIARCYVVMDHASWWLDISDLQGRQVLVQGSSSPCVTMSRTHSQSTLSTSTPRTHLSLWNLPCHRVTAKARKNNVRSKCWVWVWVFGRRGCCLIETSNVAQCRQCRFSWRCTWWLGCRASNKLAMKWGACCH